MDRSVAEKPEPQTDLAQALCAIVARQTRRAPEDLTPETRLADLGLDSLGMVELAFALEEHFEITLPFDPQAETPDLALETASLGKLEEAVRAALAAARAP